MQLGWRVGSLFGIPLYIDPSWFLILVVVALPRGAYWQKSYPEWGATTAYTAGLLMALLLFASVLLHELGHSLVARAQGIRVNSITLFLFGGVASIDQESKTPGKAFQVAIAGPAVSFALFGLLTVAALTVTRQGAPVTVLAESLASINLALALFNLLPGLPLDGGQILKAAVWKATGNRFKGVRWAARSGTMLGWTAIFLGISALLFGGDASGLWIALLGWFGVQNASGYDRMTELQEALIALKASDAMTREFRVVEATLSLRRFADTYLLDTNRASVYYAASNGRYRGLVNVEELHQIERSVWEAEPVQRIVQALDTIPTVTEATALVEVIQTMETQKLSRMTVLSPAGAVSGVIDRGDIVRALAEKMKLAISDSAIRQIKEEGAYPQGLNLGAIAQATAELTAK